MSAITIDSLTLEIDALRVAFNELNSRRFDTVPERIVCSYPVLSAAEESAQIWFAEKIARLYGFRAMLIAKKYSEKNNQSTNR